MPEYRYYNVGHDGHIVGDPIALTFDDDESAVAFGEELSGGEAVEVWEGKRLVASLRFQSSPPHLAA
jgi:hypothetical protein